MKKIFWLGLVAMMLVSVWSCDSDPKNAKLQVWLTDAPGDYEEVNVEITGVEVHSGNGNDESGWKQLEVAGGVYNLLELTNGLDTLLGTIELPAGKVSQVRLKLGDDNSIKVKGEVHALATPSGQQSGLKLQVNKTLSEGITYKILLDFDVARSVVVTGNLKYILKPVIRAITEAQDGAIKGSVSPVEATPAIYAISGSDTVGTSYADETGKFLIRGLSAGTYNVVFLPKSEYEQETVSGVVVSTGNVSDVGEVTIAETE